jgi:hypothetical protein
MRRKSLSEVDMETKKKARGKRGQGCIYLPKGSRNYWIKFSLNGKTVQQSAETESRRDALDFLKLEIMKQSNGEAADSRQTTVQAIKDAMSKLGGISTRMPRASSGPNAAGSAYFPTLAR